MLLSKWHRARGRSDSLFTVTLAQYETDFAAAAVALGMEGMRLSTHTCRHGGASVDFFLRIRTLDEIKDRGRWSQGQWVRRYKKTGAYAEQLAGTPPRLVADLTASVSALIRLL